MIAVLALGVGLQAEEPQPKKTTAAVSEVVQVAQIKKELLDMRAAKGSYMLSVYDSSASVTPLAVTDWKAFADIQLVDEKGKPHYQVQVEYPATEAPGKVFGAAKIAIPSTWRLEEFSPETVVRYAVPATTDAEEKIAEFIHADFVRVRQLPASYGVKFKREKL